MNCSLSGPISFSLLNSTVQVRNVIVFLATRPLHLDGMDGICMYVEALARNIMFAIKAYRLAFRMLPRLLCFDFMTSYVSYYDIGLRSSPDIIF